MFYVYIIFSEKLNSYYTGCSKDPDKRILYHNLGKSGSNNAYTKRSRDWQCVYKKHFNDRKDALKFEKYIKTQKSKKFIESLINGLVAQW